MVINLYALNVTNHLKVQKDTNNTQANAMVSIHYNARFAESGLQVLLENRNTKGTSNAVHQQKQIN